ncbi:hypothetical protein [Streptomyces sp. NPDC001194]|uniref:hypothetical protein n=1 Tax=Streptomyces sp. NPDC001194 TaxID=3364547 RepID=UPI00368D413D
MIRKPPAHGTPARYQGNRTGTRPPCRCRHCKNAHNRAGQLRALARIEGRPPRVPSGPTRDHVHHLLAAGMSRTQIGIAAGVSRSIVTKISKSTSPKLNRTTADKILAVKPRIVRISDLVPAVGTRRRLQALYAIGHGALAIEAATGLTGSSIRRILYSRSDTVTAATYDAVKRGYRALCASPGRNQTVKNRARRNAWPGPAAWGDDIDHPGARPETGPAYAPPAANGRDSMRMAELEHLLGLGESETAIAKQMGASEACIHDLAVIIRNRKKPAGYSAAA